MTRWYICKGASEPTHESIHLSLGTERGWARTYVHVHARRSAKSHGNGVMELMGVRAEVAGRERQGSGIRANREGEEQSSPVHGGGQNIDLWGGLRGWCPRALHPRPPTLS